MRVMKSHVLFDELQRRYNLTTDAALADALGISPAVMSKMRNGVLPVSANAVIVIHEALGLPIKEIKQLVARQLEAQAARARIKAQRDLVEGRQNEAKEGA